MIGKYKLVTITPVGRRRYIELLYPYLLRNRDIIDEHIFWVSTNNTYDISYVMSLSLKYPNFFKVRNIENLAQDYNIDDNSVFFKHNEKDTIYMRINDDICWIHPKSIKNLAAFCVNNPNYFMVYPFVINSGKTTIIQQIIGDLPIDIFPKVLYNHRDVPISFDNFTPEVCEKIHYDLFDKIKCDNFDNLLHVFNKYILFNYEYIPPHCVCWNGTKMNKKIDSANNLVTNFLTEIEPKNRQEVNAICGNSLVSHFSYRVYEKQIFANTDIYEKYRQISVGS